MQCMLIILTLPFIQGRIDLNHEHDKCLIVSETVQAMPMFAVKIVGLKDYMTIASAYGPSRANIYHLELN